jgi:hypothetical protein
MLTMDVSISRINDDPGFLYVPIGIPLGIISHASYHLQPWIYHSSLRWNRVWMTLNPLLVCYRLVWDTMVCWREHSQAARLYLSMKSQGSVRNNVNGYRMHALRIEIDNWPPRDEGSTRLALQNAAWDQVLTYSNLNKWSTDINSHKFSV